MTTLELAAFAAEIFGALVVVDGEDFVINGTRLSVRMGCQNPVIYRVQWKSFDATGRLYGPEGNKPDAAWRVAINTEQSLCSVPSFEAALELIMDVDQMTPRGST